MSVTTGSAVDPFYTPRKLAGIQTEGGNSRCGKCPASTISTLAEGQSAFHAGISLSSCASGEDA